MPASATIDAPDAAASTPSRLPRTVLVVVASIGAVLGAATICALVLQYSTHLDWSNRSQLAIVVSPVDVAVIAVVIAAVWSVLGRLWWSIAAVTGLVLVLAAANRNKVELRFEPVFPSDRDFLSEPGFLLSMVDTNTVLSRVLLVALVMLVISEIGRFVGRRFPRPRVRKPGGGLDPWLLEVRLFTFVLAAGLLAHATDFNEPRNMWRALYEADGQSWRPWSQLQNYHDNGFVGGLLYNMPVEAMERPDGYDAEAMAAIAARYAERADVINRDREGTLEDVDVVFVLSESFTDPSLVDGFTLDTNPIPRTQRRMTETVAGTTYAQLYGGGTATMEFESLTGQPIGLFQPQVSSPFQMFVAAQAGYPSVVGAFQALGHHAVAIHAYNLHMYKRPQVYETFGFDEVIDDAAMRSTSRIERSRYISDEAAYEEVLHQLDRRDEPVFVNLVTMQNHGAYGDFYADPIGSDLSDADKATEIGQYARGLAHSDRATAAFLAALEDRDEKTIVVFYGDHHPGVYSQDIIDANENDALFRTPFFVWSSESNEAQRVEAITPALFLPLVYEVADAPVPPFVALLDDARRRFGVLQHGRLLDAQGRPFSEETLGSGTRGLLEDLRLVQYDFSIGERYAVEEMWPGAVGGR